MIDALLAFALLAEAQAALALGPAHGPAQTHETAFAQTALGPSGLPVPRYASLKTNEVNARQGPSSVHPVLWVYHRAGLPLRITAESGNWRRIEDFEGDRAWVHVATLSPQRTTLITAQRVALRTGAKPKSRVRAWLQAGIVAKLLECKSGWRKLQVGRRTGWVTSAEIWGAPNCEAAQIA